MGENVMDCENGDEEQDAGEVDDEDDGEQSKSSESSEDAFIVTQELYPLHYSIVLRDPSCYNFHGSLSTFVCE